MYLAVDYLPESRIGERVDHAGDSDEVYFHWLKSLYFVLAKDSYAWHFQLLGRKDYLQNSLAKRKIEVL